MEVCKEEVFAFSERTFLICNHRLALLKKEGVIVLEIHPFSGSRCDRNRSLNYFDVELREKTLFLPSVVLVLSCWKRI